LLAKKLDFKTDFYLIFAGSNTPKIGTKTLSSSLQLLSLNSFFYKFTKKKPVFVQLLAYISRISRFKKYKRDIKRDI